MRTTKLVRLFSCLLPAVFALTACSEDPTVPGTGDAAYIELSRSTTFQEAGRPFSVSAFVRDERGNRLPTAVTATSSGASVRVDSAIFNPATSETRIWVTPVGLDSTATITATAGSLSATLKVASLPASLAITLPATIGSGANATATVNALNATGGVIGTNVKFTVVSSDTNKVKVNPDGSLTARGTGLVTLTFTGPGGKITATKDVTVVPGTFSGTITPAAGGAVAGNIVTITAPAGVAFDADTKVQIGPASNFQMVLSQTATTITALIPFGTPVGTAAVSLTNVGPQQLAFATTLPVTATGTQESTDAANNSPSTAPTVTLPVDIVGSVDGADQDDIFKIVVTAATPVSINLTWDSSQNHDLDFLLMNSTFTGASGACSAATAAVPETKTCSIQPGTWFLYVMNYDAYAGHYQGPTTYRLRVTPTP